MNLTEISVKNPYLVLAVSLLVAVLGIVSFFRTPVDLFPETSPPQVLVLTVEPGASAEDVSDKITEVLERELDTLPGLKRIRSVSRDEVSAITVEFRYSRDIDTALVDVVNAVSRVEGQLPKDILPVRVFKITEATRPVMTLALFPKADSGKTLEDIRLLAENQIKDELLSLPEVGDVDVFGGYLPEVRIKVDRDRLRSYGIGLPEVLSAISKRNITVPSGYLYSRGREYLVKTTGEVDGIEGLRNLPIKRQGGGYVLLRDVARIEVSHADQRSLFHGNGQRAIALNILRPEDGFSLETIKAVKRVLPKLKEKYPDIRFEIVDSQEGIITTNLRGMRSSLWQAVILTVLVVFLFLADRRTAGVIALSIPMSFLFSLMVLKFSPYTMNMVTLSGLIIAVGMVVDASIVVLENIYRHYHLARGKKSIFDVVLEGTKEVALANTAGAFTTIVVLIPVMFVGGYPQTVLRPLSIMIGSTIFASLLVSLTIVPLLSSRLLGGTVRLSLIEIWAQAMGRSVKRLADFYVSLTKTALRHRFEVIALVVASFVLTIRVVLPLLVGELMPPMDTGIVKITLDIPSSFGIEKVERVLSQVEQVIRSTPGFVSMSSVVGSEPGQISFGGGGATSQTVHMTVNLVTRDRRKKTIWEIEDEWREKLRKIEGLRSFSVMEYGATPISTTKAPLDLVLYGEDLDVLDAMADGVMRRIIGVPGLLDVRRSWYRDKPQLEVVPDERLCKLYGVSTEEVARLVRLAVGGGIASYMRLKDFLDIPIRLDYAEGDVGSPDDLGQIYVPTRFGQVPLRALVKGIDRAYVPPFITREDLKNTIDITGINRTATIVQVASQVGKRLRGAHQVLPAGYGIKVSGTPADMEEAKRRLMKALVLGLILLYLLLVPMYRSLVYPLVIMVAIPLAAVGAVWGLLVFNKPLCMPAIMGIILLGGTIVNNSILLLDFILQAQARGKGREDAIVDSVRIRTRPILMTATSTIVGLTPLVFEMAVGLERLSPIGIVAASGLLLGTFLTMIVVPVVYTLVDDLVGWFRPNRRVLAGVVVALFLFTSYAFAEEDKGLVVMSFRDVVKQAIEHAPDVEIASLEAEIARTERDVAHSRFLPAVDLEADLFRYQELHGILPGVAGPTQRFDDEVLSAKVVLSWLVTDFGATVYQYKALDSLYLSKKELAEWKKDLVVFASACLYAGAVAFREEREALLYRKKALEELLRRMEAFLSQGKIARVDLLRVRARLAQVESAIAEVDTAYRSSLARLEEVIGWQGRGLKLADLPDLSDCGLDLDRERAMEVALQNRKDLLALYRSREAGEWKIKSAERRYLPQILLMAGIGGFSGRDSSARFTGGDRWEDDNWIGVKVKVPLLDGGKRKAEKEKARISYRRQLLEVQKKVLEIARQVKTALAQVRSARKRMELASIEVEQARESFRLERLKYTAGKGVIDDVLSAEAQLRSAEAEFIRARRDLVCAQLQLYLAEGVLLEKLAGGCEDLS